MPHLGESNSTGEPRPRTRTRFTSAWHRSTIRPPPSPQYSFSKVPIRGLFRRSWRAAPQPKPRSPSGGPSKHTMTPLSRVGKPRWSSTLGSEWKRPLQRIASPEVRSLRPFLKSCNNASKRSTVSMPMLHPRARPRPQPIPRPEPQDRLGRQGGCSLSGTQRSGVLLAIRPAMAAIKPGASAFGVSAGENYRGSGGHEHERVARGIQCPLSSGGMVQNGSAAKADLPELIAEFDI